ncbi:DUF4234 domain-containing protein [Catenovulum maritimum]|uniref:DUF4234 domain-containing protein n=1 Tax=Catenovulum maritimum TaxID=1513271 RepID=A0A0J8H0I0_9ALTE|nr:DUF4234 domain-containing protein [Catenovulum maritimum]KMT66979.1 hypothetical protein XM47_02490 [Catenovulum maritimum]
MTTAVENAFEAPKAELSDSGESSILNLKRFSAWGVLGLGIITFGLYFVYWFYSRMPIINEYAKENKANTTYLHAYLISYAISLLISIGAGFIEPSSTVDIVSGLISIANLVLYILLAFSIRKALSEIINEDAGDNQTKLGGVLTFFFSAIYFQYKINEKIDSVSVESEKSAS